MSKYLIGYRAWVYNFIGPQYDLCPISMSTSYAASYVQQTKMIATCYRTGIYAPFGSSWPPCPISPGNDCSCGIYAVKSFRLVFDYVVEHPWYVFGKVALWGKVIEHEKGYRAEFAYPLGFYEDIGISRANGIVQNFANAWGVEILPLPTEMRQQEVFVPF